jgi:DNA-damage-inducible protein J
MSMRAASNHEFDYQTARDAVVCARISSELKHDVESVLNRLGLTMSEAINIYLAQIQLNEGIPFAIKVPKLPNKTTLKTFAETDRGKKVVKVKSVREIFKKAGL